MKILPVFLLAITTILVSTALAAPILNMYSDGIDCRACHNDANILRNTNHENSHNESTGIDSCLICHKKDVLDVQMKLDCMVSDCHINPEDLNSGDSIGVANHHELEVESCLICHEKGVPRGNL